MRGKKYGEPPIDEEGYSRGGRKRRRRGGLVAEGTLSEHRLDTRPRKSKDDAVNGRVLPPPLGDRGAPLPVPLRSTRPSSPPSIDEGAPQMKRGGHITAAGRRALPSSDFGLPGKGTGPEGKGSGSYPIDTPGRARSALSRASANASPAAEATIRRKVHARYPQIGQG